MVTTLNTDDEFSRTGFDRRHDSIIEHNSYSKFDNSMNEFIKLFESLDFLINGRNLAIVSDDAKMHFFDTQLLQSAKNTLRSIKLCCEYGNISDANTLIRKFRDDIFFYLYVLELDNNRDILFDETGEANYGRHNKHEEFVIKWFNNQLGSFDFSKNIVPYLKTNNDIKEAIEKYKLEETWRKIYKNLNNYVHNNGVAYCTMNYRNHRYEDIEKIFKDIIYKIDYISTVFMLMLILVKPYYIMASDYIDYRDIGMEPPDGCQYWVAPFIQEFIDEHMAHHNPEYKLFLKDKVYMNIG